MAGGPTAAAKLLPKYVTPADPPRRARDLVAEIALAECWCDGEASAYELGERWEESFLAAVQLQLTQSRERRSYVEYDINSSARDMVQGAAFIEPIDPPEVKEQKARRSRLSDYEAAVGELTPEEFEWLCRGILVQLGATSTGTTRYVADEGVDFWGRLPLGVHLVGDAHLVGVPRDLALTIVGQAKHYPASQVSTYALRDLVGAVSLARGRATGAGAVGIAGLDLLVCEPVLFLLMTTGKISRNSWRLIEASGAAGMDGGAIASLLASRGIGTENDAFSGAEFKAWLAQFGPDGPQPQ